jgi:hypothetical protein
MDYFQYLFSYGQFSNVVEVHIYPRADIDLYPVEYSHVYFQFRIHPFLQEGSPFWL